MPTSFAFAGFLSLAMLLTGCSGSTDLTKIDAGLRLQIEQADEADAIDCLIGLSTEAPSDARGRLEGIGLEVRTVAGDVVTARGSAEAVRRATRFDWVVRIEASQVRPASAPA